MLALTIGPGQRGRKKCSLECTGSQALCKGGHVHGKASLRVLGRTQGARPDPEESYEAEGRMEQAGSQMPFLDKQVELSGCSQPQMMEEEGREAEATGR